MGAEPAGSANAMGAERNGSRARGLGERSENLGTAGARRRAGRLSPRNIKRRGMDDRARAEDATGAAWCGRVFPQELSPAAARAVTWYPYLVAKAGDAARDALFAREAHLAGTGFVVCLESVPFGGAAARGKPRKLFARFPSALVFYAWLTGPVLKAQRCCFEVIRGAAPQKPYFDIDMPVAAADAARLSRDAVEAAVRELGARAQIVSGVDAARFMVFSSHSEAKYSFHIVLDGVAVATNAAAREFHAAAVAAARAAGVEPALLAHVDAGVYSATQQFRIVGCQKYGTARVKVFRSELSDWTVPEESRQPDVKIFAASLVSNVSGCVPPDARSVAARAIEEKARARPRAPFRSPARAGSGGGAFVSPEDAERALEALCAELCRLGAGSAPFRLRAEAGGYECQAPDVGFGAASCIVPLDREAASYCPSCRRQHETENPFMIVWPGAPARAAFCCRRGGSKISVELDLQAAPRRECEARAAAALPQPPPRLTRASLEQAAAAVATRPVEALVSEDVYLQSASPSAAQALASARGEGGAPSGPRWPQPRAPFGAQIKRAAPALAPGEAAGAFPLMLRPRLAKLGGVADPGKQQPRRPARRRTQVNVRVPIIPDFWDAIEAAQENSRGFSR